MRSRSFTFALPFALGLCAADANAARHFFSATIDGAQETPPSGSPATGSGSFVLDTTAGTASYNITFSGLRPPRSPLTSTSRRPVCRGGSCTRCRPGAPR
jgi:hypothetical protein